MHLFSQSGPKGRDRGRRSRPHGGVFPKVGGLPPILGRFKRERFGERGNRNPLSPTGLSPFLPGQKGEHLSFLPNFSMIFAAVIPTTTEIALASHTADASSQLPYPSLPRKRESSLISVFLLSPAKPLRWVSQGAPILPAPYFLKYLRRNNSYRNRNCRSQPHSR